MFSNAFQFINRIRTELCDIAAQASHIYSASPKLVVELMDEIDALKAQIENLGGVPLAEVKTNEA